MAKARKAHRHRTAKALHRVGCESLPQGCPICRIHLAASGDRDRSPWPTAAAVIDLLGRCLTHILSGGQAVALARVEGAYQALSALGIGIAIALTGRTGGAGRVGAVITGCAQIGCKEIRPIPLFDRDDLPPVSQAGGNIMPVLTGHGAGMASDAFGLVKIES